MCGAERSRRRRCGSSSRTWPGARSICCSWICRPGSSASKTWSSSCRRRHEDFRIPPSALRTPVKFLCVECDRQMVFEERQVPGDGTLAVAFRCPACGRVVAMLTNPMETQLVASLGVKIGGVTLPPQPLETVRGMVATGKEDAFDDGRERGAGKIGRAHV